MTFYDASGDVLYDFFKENPRTVQGHTAGNLAAPPAPTPLNENADSGGPMVRIISCRMKRLLVSGVSAKSYAGHYARHL